MKEVAPRFWVGGQADAESVLHECPERWWIVHACKEPYHRQFVGYSSRGAPKESREYLVAIREGRVALNIVDVDDPAYMRRELFDASVEFIDEAARRNVETLTHCNQGRSRGPSVAIYYLRKRDLRYSALSFDDARALFMESYPEYQPASGVEQFLRAHWAADA